MGKTRTIAHSQKNNKLTYRLNGGKGSYMFRKEDLIVNYFCPKTTADSQIADIPFMEGITKEDFFRNLHEWLINFAEDYWSEKPEAADEDEIYIQERNEDGEYIILDSIKKKWFDFYYDYDPTAEDEPFDSDREPDVDFNGDWN